MSIRKLVLVIGLCVLVTGCATGSNNGPGSSAMHDNSNKGMGVRYLLGRGVQPDNEKAFYYFSKAANDGDAFAQNEVAYMYAAGKGTNRDYTQAVKWYTKAAEHGLASAQYNLGLLYLHGLGTPVNKTLATQWFKKSAAHGFELAKQALQNNARS